MNRQLYKTSENITLCWCVLRPFTFHTLASNMSTNLDNWVAASRTLAFETIVSASRFGFRIYWIGWKCINSYLKLSVSNNYDLPSKKTRSVIKEMYVKHRTYDRSVTSSKKKKRFRETQRGKERNTK